MVIIVGANCVRPLNEYVHFGGFHYIDHGIKMTPLFWRANAVRPYIYQLQTALCRFFIT